MYQIQYLLHHMEDEEFDEAELFASTDEKHERGSEDEEDNDTSSVEGGDETRYRGGGHSHTTEGV